METILVSGGAGFIGSHVCDRLLELGYKVVAVDDFNDYYDPEQKRKNLLLALRNENFRLYELDICDKEMLDYLFNKHGFSCIIHLAARAGVRNSLTEPFLYEKTNVNGTLAILELAKKHNIKQLIYASSSSVYGNNKKMPFSETDNTDMPVSLYAATKKAGELLCYAYHKLYSMNIACLRFFTVYGPRGRPDMAPFIFMDSISKGKPIMRFGPGTTKRDYTFIADIVDGVIAAMAIEGYEIINLGNNKAIELNYFISAIENIVGKKSKIIEKPIPKGDVPLTYADISKAKRLLGYSPKTQIEKGLEIFWQWLKEQK